MVILSSSKFYYAHGWAPKDNRELFTLNEFVEHFDINGFQEANPRFCRTN